MQRWAERLVPGHSITIESFGLMPTDAGRRLVCTFTLDGRMEVVSVQNQQNVYAMTDELGERIREKVAQRWALEVPPHDQFWESGTGAQFVAAGAGRTCLEPQPAH